MATTDTVTRRRKPTRETFERGLTIEEFLAFTDTRPDDERWELIEGVPVLSPSPVDYHQVIVQNLCMFLGGYKLQHGAPWMPLPGIGQRVPASGRSLPIPDVIVKAGPLNGTPVSDEALVLFEVLSRSNTKKDRAWRQKVYASVVNCEHYVTIGMKAVDVTTYDRASGWAPRTVKDVTGALDLPALGLALPLDVVYRWTPHAAA